LQAHAMELSDIEFCDQDIILALTLSLPSSYDNVVISFDSIPPNQLTLDNVITRLTGGISSSHPPCKVELNANEAMAAVPGCHGKVKTSG
jgi:hypothetical protein